jgi:hypothetical protein
MFAGIPVDLRIDNSSVGYSPARISDLSIGLLGAISCVNISVK